VSKPTVIGWKKRYAVEGIGWLTDRPKPGRPVVVDETQVVLATLEPPPDRLGVTHWSSRLLAGELGISRVWVSKIWRRWGLQPWRAETFKFSTDPQLEAKIRDVIITRQAIRRGSFDSVERTHRCHRAVHRRLERTLSPVRPDQDRRPATRPLPTRSRTIVYTTLVRYRFGGLGLVELD
jgi:transposase